RFPCQSPAPRRRPLAPSVAARVRGAGCPPCALRSSALRSRQSRRAERRRCEPAQLGSSPRRRPKAARRGARRSARPRDSTEEFSPATRARPPAPRWRDSPPQGSSPDCPSLRVRGGLGWGRGARGFSSPFFNLRVEGPVSNGDLMAGEKVGRGHRALARRLKLDQQERTGAACHLDTSPRAAQYCSRCARAVAEARSPDLENLPAKVNERSRPGLKCADLSLELGSTFSEIQQAVLLFEHRGEHHTLAALRRWTKLAA